MSARSAASKPGAITFAKDKAGKPDILTGTISAVYVRLHQGGKPIERQWIEKKEEKKARLNLWFDSRYGAGQRVGMDFWVEATGAQQSPHYLKVAADTRTAVKLWNEASERHKGYAEQFKRLFKEWCESVPRGQVEVGVYALRFKGRNRIWKGGGDYAGVALERPRVTPQEALDFLTGNQEGLLALSHESGLRRSVRPSTKLSPRFASLRWPFTSPWTCWTWVPSKNAAQMRTDSRNFSRRPWARLPKSRLRSDLTFP